MNSHLLLINPSVNPTSQSAIVTAMLNKSLPTSLGVLAGYVQAAGLTRARVVDEQIESLSDPELAAAVLGLASPRIVGLSVLTISSARAHDLARRVKRVDPQCHVVCGGIHASVLPEEMLANPAVDAVVRGEGEETLAELVDCILNDRDWRGCQGLSVRSGSGTVHNDARPLMGDLDRLPRFPYDMFAACKDKYGTFGAVFGSRGCPYNCIFCSSRSISGRRYPVPQR